MEGFVLASAANEYKSQQWGKREAETESAILYYAGLVRPA